MNRQTSDDYFEEGEVASGDGEGLDIAAIQAWIADFLADLWCCRFLLVAVLVLLTILNVWRYLVTEPVFTAQATIGPPNPSPINSMLASGGLGGTSSFARTLLGGGGGVNDLFQEFKQLLDSPRLATELATKDHFLQQLYAGGWDAENKVWRKPGSLFQIKAAILRTLNRPVVDHPTPDLLRQYLGGHLSAGPATQVGNSAVANVAGLGSNYLVLSLTADNPQKAEQQLSTIVHRADEIIRQEQLRDVQARISFISSELPSVTQTAQRQSLIDILASQEELKVMLIADKRFAHVLVSMPYASPTPTTPMSPAKSMVYVIFLAGVVWVLLVAGMRRWHWLQRLLGIFAQKRPGG